MSKKQPSPITEKDIQEFLKQTSLLRECKYFQMPSSAKINYKKGEGIKFSAQMPLREDIEVILIRIRPFIEYYERLHLGRIITYLLEKHGNSDFLKACQTLFQPESEKQYASITVNNKEYRMRDLLLLYMYGKYLHLDAEKQEISAAFEQVWGSMAEVFALSQIDKYAGLIFSVAGYIRKNKLYEV